MSKKFTAIYGVLFLALLLQPHIIKGHVARLDAPYIQSLVTAIIIGAAALVYTIHARDVKEKQRLKEEQARAIHHLTDLSAELGLVNRRLPLLHELTTEMLGKARDARKHRQALMEQLLETLVVSLSQSDWGVFRFVDTTEGRTVGEFLFTSTKAPPASIIGNKALINVSKAESIGLEEPYRVVATTDKAATVRCHYIMPRSQLANRHGAFIQNVVDQAQVMYKYLYQ